MLVLFSRNFEFLNSRKIQKITYSEKKHTFYSNETVHSLQVKSHMANIQFFSLSNCFEIKKTFLLYTNYRLLCSKSILSNCEINCVEKTKKILISPAFQLRRVHISFLKLLPKCVFNMLNVLYIIASPCSPFLHLASFPKTPNSCSEEFPKTPSETTRVQY